MRLRRQRADGVAVPLSDVVLGGHRPDDLPEVGDRLHPVEPLAGPAGVGLSERLEVGEVGGRALLHLEVRVVARTDVARIVRLVEMLQARNKRCTMTESTVSTSA